MKKLITMMVGLTVASAAFAANAIDYGYVSVSPAVGEAESVEKVEIKFNKDAFQRVMPVIDRQGATLTLNGEPLKCELRKLFTGVGVYVKNLSTETTTPGKYVLTIAAGALRFDEKGNGYNDDLATTNPESYVFEYNIKGASQGGDGDTNEPTVVEGKWGYTLTPGLGKLSQLSEITMAFSNPDYVEFEINNQPTLTCNGNNVPGNASFKGKTMTFKLNEPATAPGTYKFTIAEGDITGDGGDDGEGGYTIFDDCPEISFEYTIEAAAGQLDWSASIEPSENTSVSAIEDMKVTFSGLDSFTLAEGCPQVKVNDSPLAATDFSTSIAGNVLTITPAEKFEGPATVSVVFPAAGITGTKGETTAANPEEISFNYTLVGAVVYDLTLQLTGPTKLNADNEINVGEKQISSFFFSADQVGLDAASGTEPNVTLKEVNGDYERTARLVKGNGLDATKTFFMADFGTEPSFNGEYVLTVAKGAFGDAAWIANPEMGESNDEIVINFTIVGGRDYDYNTIVATVTPEAGQYDSFSKIATVTLAFDEDVTAEEDAGAVLMDTASFAGYNQTASFVKSETEANTYSVTFPAPESEAASVTYELNIPAGQFKNAEGLGNKAVKLNYTVSKSTGVGVIGIDTEADDVYTIDGRRVIAKELPAGIYVVNGAKVLVK